MTGLGVVMEETYHFAAESIVRGDIYPPLVGQSSIDDSPLVLVGFGFGFGCDWGHWVID